MDRRKALRNIGILTGGIMLLPSCEFSEEKFSLALNNLKVSEKQESLVKDIVATIIPEGDLPGAASLNVQGFVWIMVDDCLEETLQESFMKGLNKFDKQVKRISGKYFNKLDQQEQIEAFRTISEDDDDLNSSVDSDVKFFLSTTKNFSMQGYLKSKYIMTEIMPYTLVPTTYGPCETIDKSKRINING